MEFLNIIWDPHNVTFTLILCEYYNTQNASNFLNFRLNSKIIFSTEAQVTGHLPRKTEVPSKAKKIQKKIKKWQSAKHSLCEISSHKNASNFLKN